MMFYTQYITIPSHSMPRMCDFVLERKVHRSQVVPILTASFQGTDSVIAKALTKAKAAQPITYDSWSNLKGSNV